MHEAMHRLITSANLVTVDPSDKNIAALLSAAFKARFDEMPREFLDAPAVDTVPGSIGELIARELRKDDRQQG